MKNIQFVDLKKQYKKIRNKINKRIQDSLIAGDFILGEEVKKFEKEFASYCNVKYCVGLDNGSSALELGMRALGIGVEDEVITPVNSFIASSSAISFTGAIPVWVDCDRKTYNIDVSQIEKKITKKTKAVMVVHLCGQMAEMDTIIKIAIKNKLFIVEDACQAHGAQYKGRKAGSFGDFAAFSFYPGKNLGAYGDAGALVTNNRKIYDMVQTIRNYGQTKKYHHEFLAWNRRLDTIQAAILRVKLEYLDKWNEYRRKKAALYNKLLRGLPLILPTEEENNHIYHLYVIRTKKRDKLQNYLFSKGITTGIHYPVPINLQKAYRDMNMDKNAFPVAYAYSKEYLSLPIYPELSFSEIKYICREIKNFFNES